MGKLPSVAMSRALPSLLRRWEKMEPVASKPRPRSRTIGVYRLSRRFGSRPLTSAAGGRCRRAKPLRFPRKAGTGRPGEPDADAGPPPLGRGWADAHYLATN